MQSVTRFALFDDTHGQPNWSQTGFPSRELDADCSGLADVLRGMGYDCAGVRPRLLSDRLSHPCLLVVPPPTGYYNPARQTWQPLTSSLFTPAEVRDILRFIDGGGRLLAFAYRFGDSFTRTNLRDLFAPSPPFSPVLPTAKPLSHGLVIRRARKQHRALRERTSKAAECASMGPLSPPA